ncbi:hypothetical protein [Sanguibacter gelidistatuariae]|uniref:hypothetical protein n=1 Tax=Sanguibacter gelidistatuariae TaxID=1814289 RepID=UPI000B86183B|nr:hypothetical protein [Sanguibacter gelidistatuariae]
MESNLGQADRDEASDALNILSADRERLAEHVQAPWALLAAFGALSAWVVGAAATADPGANYEPSSTAWLAVLGALVVAHLVQHETGICFRTMGARAIWAMIGILAACLILFSVSLGLVSLSMRWAVVLTTLAAFGITTWLAGVAYQSAAENLRRE